MRIEPKKLAKFALDLVFVFTGIVLTYVVINYIKSYDQGETIEKQDAASYWNGSTGMKRDEADKKYRETNRKDGILSIRELRVKDSSAYNESFDKLQEDLRQELYESCLHPLKMKIKDSKLNFPFEDEEPYYFFLVISIESKDNIGMAKFVKIDDGSAWPFFFDEEAKQCYISKINNKKYATTRDYKYTCSIPYCLSTSRIKDLYSKE